MSELFSPAKKIGHLLTEELKNDPHFYFFSPDETTSNKFDQIFETEKRAWSLPTKTWDLPASPDGRIIEMLSENVLFSVMSGHLMNGEKAMMGSYEAFFPIVTAQILQQIKFFKQSQNVTWRQPIPAVNLLSTSVCWRQDHNGFTHQSPALISTLLDVPSNLANCLFPIDDIAAAAAYRFMINSTNVVNLTTFDKNDRPRYLTPAQAKAQLKTGAIILEDFSDQNPDFIFTAAGDIVSHEAIEAIKILKTDLPDIKLRFVGISALTYQAIGTTKNQLSTQKFTDLLTNDKPIIANFHGYPETLTNILANYTNKGRIHTHGFIEEGSTTTPFEMLRKNHASRYDLAIEVAKILNRQDLISKYEAILAQNHFHAINYGTDLV